MAPRGELLKGASGAQHGEVLPPAADDLQAHGQAIDEAAGHASSGQAGEVHWVGEGRPT